jgi:hypothetical protein
MASQGGGVITGSRVIMGLLENKHANKQEQVLLYYPFTLPITRPLVKYFCKNGYSIIIGRAPRKS